jgi:hypothetical protein
MTIELPLEFSFRRLTALATPMLGVFRSAAVKRFRETMENFCLHDVHGLLATFFEEYHRCHSQVVDFLDDHSRQFEHA